uniref:Uncharacterized protein n=1 Tax=Timema shepardi TaxID=629360 RepID=A0A7R9G248_TIMSH|nr:unnamed protein product [Timema shepardi]
MNRQKKSFIVALPQLTVAKSPRSQLRLKVMCRVHPTEIRISISPSSAAKQLNTTSALANYATEAGTRKVEEVYQHLNVRTQRNQKSDSNPLNSPVMKVRQDEKYSLARTSILPQLAVTSILLQLAVTSILPLLVVTSILPQLAMTSILPQLAVTSILPSLAVTSILPSLAVTSILPQLAVTSILPQLAVTSILPQLAVTSILPQLAVTFILPQLAVTSILHLLAVTSILPQIVVTSILPKIVKHILRRRRVPLPDAVTVVMQVVDVQVVGVHPDATRGLLFLPLAAPVLAALDARRHYDEQRQDAQRPGAYGHVQQGDAELVGAVGLLLVEPGGAVAGAVAPQGGADARVQFRTPGTIESMLHWGVGHVERHKVVNN